MEDTALWDQAYVWNELAGPDPHQEGLAVRRGQAAEGAAQPKQGSEGGCSASSSLLSSHQAEERRVAMGKPGPAVLCEGLSEFSEV
jgi:hypothetical protein